MRTLRPEVKTWSQSDSQGMWGSKDSNSAVSGSTACALSTHSCFSGFPPACPQGPEEQAVTPSLWAHSQRLPQACNFFGIWCVILNIDAKIFWSIVSHDINCIAYWPLSSQQQKAWFCVHGDSQSNTQARSVSRFGKIGLVPNVCW